MLKSSVISSVLKQENKGRNLLVFNVYIGTHFLYVKISRATIHEEYTGSRLMLYSFRNSCANACKPYTIYTTNS